MNTENFNELVNTTFDDAEKLYESERSFINEYDKMVNRVDELDIFHTEKIHVLIHNYRDISEHKHKIINNFKTLIWAIHNSVSFEEIMSLKRSYVSSIIELESINAEAEEVGKRIDAELKNILNIMETILA